MKRLLYNIHKRDIRYYVVYPALAIVLSIAVGVLLLVFLFLLQFPSIGGLKRAVERIEVVDSVISVSQVLHEHQKSAEMTVLLKNGLKVSCVEIEFLGSIPFIAKPLLFGFPKIQGYTLYGCLHDTNENIYIRKKDSCPYGVYLQEFLEGISSLGGSDDNDAVSQFFITDESFLEKTDEEIYNLLPDSPWNSSEDGICYKYFFVRPSEE